MANILQTAFLPSTSTLRRPPISGSKAKSQSVQVKAKIREIFMLALSSTMTEGKIVSWMKSEGDRSSKGESVVVVESDKADMDVESFHEGFLATIMVEEGGVAPVGSAIALLAETEDEIAEAKAKSQPLLRIVASPYAKKLAKELKVDLGTVVGTGPLGRIVAKDVDAAAAAGVVNAASPASPAIAAPVASGIELGTVVPFTTMQSAVSRNMVESLSLPTFRVGYTITTCAVDALYKKIKSKGVTMTALLAKATALALALHPVVNSCCKDGNSFTYNSSINIAVAVAIDGGLITPVLQDADKVDIYTLSRKWKELVDKARAKQLQPHEYNTGTFTLSNLGMFGVDRFDAILPPGTGAIMAVGASQPAVVASKDGRIGVKNQMQVNVTADHRVIYGADLASFLQTLAKIIEDPKDLTL
ncbi:Dihydrolipoyllysine-residue acetyltransferase component 5 of pyruvate dehydrogenase complex [Hibiscus syriacus]|uniref:Dihydrolipoamide acetyltransferase component of pyruvate dehydrogenase complex n=1 Tax=Hibiscus syriacus TaxID=106335 RepID=A0A6A3AZ59_HIBSY|nr:Dihydrolipoyllysine-residue acetyltransferase component 5 of pyruvate dehydrogenase complex [Hibiscus syriacus]